MSIKTMSLSELNIIGIQVNLPTGFLGDVETFILSNKTNKICGVRIDIWTHLMRGYIID